ncbi:MAG: ATP-dependent DNA helicase UvrD/PcrA, partial [uncultured Quadrisphaera sp.]
APHREGPGVPGGLPDRPGGRRLPAPARPGRPAGAGGGTPAGLRRHHPRAAAAVHLPGHGAHQLGPAGLQPAVPVPRRDPDRDHPLGASRPDPGAVHGLPVGADEGGGDRPVHRWPARRRRQPAGHLGGRRRPGQPRRVRPGHRGRGDRGRRQGAGHRGLRFRGHQAPRPALRPAGQAL